MSTPQQRLHDRIRLCLLVLICTGALATLLAVVWRPVLDTVAIDVILTPDELRDPTLREVVIRTQAHRPPSNTEILLGITGVVVFCVSLATWVMYERLDQIRESERPMKE